MENVESHSAAGETGARLHRRETRYQIYLPYGLGLLLILGLMSSIALPHDPIWRVRVQTIADWMTVVFCLLPLTLCLFPVFLIVVVGIYGMHRIHSSTERPLRRLENAASSMVRRIDGYVNQINQKTTNLEAAMSPVMNKMSIFDTSGDEEISSGERTE